MQHLKIERPKPRDIFVELESLPEAGPHGPRRRWTKEEDEALLHYWPIKRHTDVARTLGVCKDTALKRYRELTDESAR